MNETMRDDTANYTQADMDRAETAIRTAVPNAIIQRTGDYGWAMSAARADRSGGIIVFRPARPDRDRSGVVTPIEEVIAFLKRT